MPGPLSRDSDKRWSGGQPGHWDFLKLLGSFPCETKVEKCRFRMSHHGIWPTTSGRESPEKESGLGGTRSRERYHRLVSCSAGIMPFGVRWSSRGSRPFVSRFPVLFSTLAQGIKPPDWYQEGQPFHGASSSWPRREVMGLTGHKLL